MLSRFPLLSGRFQKNRAGYYNNPVVIEEFFGEQEQIQEVVMPAILGTSLVMGNVANIAIGEIAIQGIATTIGSVVVLSKEKVALSGIIMVIGEIPSFSNGITLQAIQGTCTVIGAFPALQENYVATIPTNVFSIGGIPIATISSSLTQGAIVSCSYVGTNTISISNVIGTSYAIGNLPTIISGLILQADYGDCDCIGNIGNTKILLSNPEGVCNIIGQIGLASQQHIYFAPIGITNCQKNIGSIFIEIQEESYEICFINHNSHNISIQYSAENNVIQNSWYNPLLNFVFSVPTSFVTVYRPLPSIFEQLISPKIFGFVTSCEPKQYFAKSAHSGSILQKTYLPNNIIQQILHALQGKVWQICPIISYNIASLYHAILSIEVLQRSMEIQIGEQQEITPIQGTRAMEIEVQQRKMDIIIDKPKIMTIEIQQRILNIEVVKK